MTEDARVSDSNLVVALGCYANRHAWPAWYTLRVSGRAGQKLFFVKNLWRLCSLSRSFCNFCALQALSPPKLQRSRQGPQSRHTFVTIK